MAPPLSVKFEPNIPLMLRDGTITYVDVFRPDTADKYPALLGRTPYGKAGQSGRYGHMDPIRAASLGFAVVIQDVRGRHSSDGEFYPFVNEIDDGYDSVEWAANQSWCTGKVGMYGVSYVGATQWLAAKSSPPSLSAIAPGFTASDYHEGWAWRGGAFELGFNLSWSMGHLTAGNWDNLSRRMLLGPEQLERLIASKDRLTDRFGHVPLQDLPELRGLAQYYYDWLDHPEYDSYWQRISIEESHSQISVPGLNYGGWFDIFLGGTIRNFSRMREMGASEAARKGQRLLIGPWVHSGPPTNVSGDYAFGYRSAAAELDLYGLILRYYDHWLKDEDNGVGDEQPVRIFVMGDNVWRFENEWPLHRAEEVNYYLHSGGRANTLNGDGSLSREEPHHEPTDVYAYNPIDPVPTRGGGLCCDPAFVPPGAYDQRPIEIRPDVLVYTTPPLEKDTEVTGPVTVTFYASSSATDTDFTAKLIDVDDCGCAMNVADGIVRARYRLPRQPGSLIQPGDVYEYTIDLWATSNVFKRGHSIRLDLSSSNFPKYDRNANTGAPIGTDAGFASALQTVHHSSDYPSHVKLPIVPRE